MRVAILLILLTGPQEPARPLDDIVVATVDGEAILKSEIEAVAELARGGRTRTDLLRGLVVDRLLRQRARAAGLAVPEDRLNDAMASRVAAAGGFAAYRAELERNGTNLEQDRKLVYEAMLIDTFVDHCLGRVPSSPHVRPALARAAQVSPKEVQTFYRENRERFRVPAMREIGRFVIEKGGGERTAAESGSLAAELRARLGRDGADPDAVAAEVDASYARRVVLDSDLAALKPEIRAFLVDSSRPRVSDAIETASAFVVIVRIRDEPSRIVPFDEAQPKIFEVLGEGKIRDARETLLRELVAEAEVWPNGLFADDAAAEDGPR